jgi:hypothetical protein
LLGITDIKALPITLHSAGDARAQMITLALVLAAHEIDLDVHA